MTQESTAPYIHSCKLLNYHEKKEERKGGREEGREGGGRREERREKGRDEGEKEGGTEGEEKGKEGKRETWDLNNKMALLGRYHSGSSKVFVNLQSLCM